MTGRKPLLKTTSPATALLPGATILFEQTWYGHILPEHSDVPLAAVGKAMSDPCTIYQSATAPGDYVMMNTNAMNAHGEPLRVPVHPRGDGTNVVTSAYFSGTNSHMKVLWQRGDG